MDRRAYLRSLAGASVIGVSAIGVSGCLGVGADDHQEYDIGMATHAFSPEAYEVAVGDTVVWNNTSSHAHTVTAYEDSLPNGATFFASGDFDDESTAREAWNSETGGSLYQGDTFRHTFEVAGEYRYFCVPHERSNMVGTVIVE